MVLKATLAWIFGEIVRKTVFQQRADTITPKAIYLLKAFSIIFYPVLLIFAGLTRLIAAIFSTKLQPRHPFTLREQIPALIEAAPDTGDLEEVEQSMIRRLFDFREATAEDVMVPLIDVVAIDEKATVGELIRLASRRYHTRIPIYSGRVDKVVGMVNALELLGMDPSQPITRWMQQPVNYVPGVKSAEELLVEMRQGRQRMSIVVDEFGGAEGIVTIEDIVEEVVVEEIEDEYDVPERTSQMSRKVGDCDYIVSVRVELDALKEELGIELPEGDYTSLAGFLLHTMWDMPEKESVIEHGSLTCVIEKAILQAIIEVRVRW